MEYIIFIFLLMFYLKNTIINYIKTIEIFKKVKKREKIKMRIKKIKDNFYEELGMNKYDFFNNLVNEIGNFPYVVSNIYEDNSTKTTLNKKRVFRINGVDYFQIEEKEKYSEIYRIEIENDIKIEYYSKDLEYESFGNVGFLYKEKNFDIENKSLKGKELNFERYRDNRDEMNVERISKEDFLKELEIIIVAYKDIYNDIEIEEIFGRFKENF